MPSTTDWEQFRRRVDESLIVLFAMVGESLGRATRALLAQDRERADGVIAEDRDIDRHCESLTALVKERLADAARRPAELEELIAVLQMVPELERSADLAEHIARRTLADLGGVITPKARGTIQAMNDVAVRMWQEVASAYIDRSRAAAFDMSEADDELDSLAAGLVEEAIASGAEPRVTAEVALLARFYERSGDHAVNLARRIDGMLAPRRSTSAVSRGRPAAGARRAAAEGGLVGRLRRMRLMPHDEGFFDLFRAAAVNARDCADELRKMIAGLGEPVQEHYEAVRRLERAGDQINVELRRRLDSSFVTPYDREDIHALAESLDDVVDDMFAVAELIQLVKVGSSLPGFPELAEVLVAMAAEMVELIECLQAKEGARYHLEKIESMEREGDVLYRRLMAQLFSGEYDALEVLRWKDMVQALEDSLNKIEDVSDVVESILVKDS